MIDALIPSWFAAAVQLADVAILWYMFLVNSFFALLLALAAPQLFAHWRFGSEDVLARSLTSSAVPRVSILVPAHNESVSIVDSLRSLLTLQYPYYEVVLVNDGSTDDTMQRLHDAYDLYEVPPAVMRRLRTEHVKAYYRSRTWSKLLVVDKQNGGKADSLNVALDAARFPYVLACDADTLIEPDALLRLARPVPLRPEDRRRRRHDSRRQLVHGRGRPGHRCARRRPLALGHPDGRVPARVPVRAPGLEPAGRQSDHLGRLRPLPPRLPHRDPRLRHEHGHRRLRAHRAAAALPARNSASPARWCSFPTRSRGRKCPRRWRCSAASANAGTAASSPRWWRTARCSSTRATAPWGSSPCPTS